MPVNMPPEKVMVTGLGSQGVMQLAQLNSPVGVGGDGASSEY